MYYKRKRYFNDVHKTFVSMFVFLCKVLWAFKVSWKTAFDIVYALFELWLGVVFNLCSFRQFMFLKNCVSVFCFKKFLLYFYSSHELMKFKLKISAIIYIFFNLFSVFLFISYTENFSLETFLCSTAALSVAPREEFFL